MKDYLTFREYAEQRDTACRARTQSPGLEASGHDLAAGSPMGYDLPEPDVAEDEGRVEERSVFGNLFKNPFKAVNPARPVLPTNSRLLASPFRRKPLKSQVVGQ